MVPPPLPVIVRTTVPGEIPEVVETLRLDEKGGVPEGWLNDVDTPEGAPLTLKATG